MPRARLLSVMTGVACVAALAGAGVTSVLVGGPADRTPATAPDAPGTDADADGPTDPRPSTDARRADDAAPPPAAEGRPPPPPGPAASCAELRAADVEPLEVLVRWLAADRRADLEEEPGRPCSVTFGDTAELPAMTTAFPVVGDASWSTGGHAYPAVDIFAAEGTPVVSPVDGVVELVRGDDRWDPAIDDPDLRAGLAVAVHGFDGRRYYGSHLASVTEPLAPGDVVAAGDPLGTVGTSGNAAGTPPHLHFGISEGHLPPTWDVRRGTIDPSPFLREVDPS